MKECYELECMRGRKEYYAVKNLCNLAQLVNDDEDYDDYLDWHVINLPERYYYALCYFDFIDMNDEDSELMFRDIADDVNDFVNKYYR